MPLHKTFTDRNSHIAIWHTTEQPEELCELLPPPLRDIYRHEATTRFSSTARQMEWLAARVLAHCHFQIPHTLAYDPNGRPYIPGSDSYISISHSREYVAVAISAAPVGLDIEYSIKRAFRLRRKYLTPDELADLSHSFAPFMAPQAALIAWTAKEAAFKYYAHLTPLNTITDVSLSRFSIKVCLAASTIPENGRCQVRHFFFCGLFCSVASAGEEAD